MSIAYDTASEYNSYPGSTTSYSMSMTIANNPNRFLSVATGASATSVTWNGTSLTLKNSFTDGKHWVLTNPTAGSYSVVVNQPNGYLVVSAASYYGLDQTIPLGTGVSKSGASDPISFSVTNSNSNSWALFVGMGDSFFSNGTNYVFRIGGNKPAIGDTGAIKSGTFTMAVTTSRSTSWAGYVYEMNAFALTGPVNVKTWDGLTLKTG